MRNEDRSRLHQTSKNRIKNWTNTIEAQRLKHEEDRIKRLEDDEVRLQSDCRLLEGWSMQRSRSFKTS
jgi:hypothetical protein